MAQQSIKYAIVTEKMKRRAPKQVLCGTWPSHVPFPGPRDIIYGHGLTHLYTVNRRVFSALGDGSVIITLYVF